MARQKVKTIFNKNHISLVKTENVEHENGLFYDASVGHIQSLSNLGRNEMRESKTINIKKKSPLGFTYISEEYIRPKRESLEFSKICIKLYAENTLHELCFYDKWGESKVNAEVRPWEVVSSDKSIAEHFIKDLLNEVNKFFELAKEYKFSPIQIVDRYAIPNERENLSEFKNRMYVKLFGHKNGLVSQTNSEKILTHGFDLKTSFRKM